MQRILQSFGWKDFHHPLFYNSPFSLRFELGYPHEMGPVRFIQAMDRARAITSFVFSKSSDLTIAVPFYSRHGQTDPPPKLEKALRSTNFSGIISGIDRIETADLAECWDLEAGCYRFLCSLRLPNQEDQILPFIWAAVAEEMGIGPRFSSIAKSYIADPERGLVVHIYDDRGMDVIAVERQTLRPCYERFNDWLLDYGRDRMDATFSSSTTKDS